MAKEKKQDPANILAAQLKAEYQNWHYYYEQGGNDPSWPDGVNLELIRNHIIYAKSQCEELLTPEQYPPEYHLPLPPVVRRSYMARASEIRTHAKVTLQSYLTDKNFQFLISHLDLITKKSEFQNVVGYVQSLKIAIARDDLVVMRRHERPDVFLKSFASARQQMEEQLRKARENQEGIYEQLSLFA